MGAVNYKLKHPVIVGEETISSLTLDRPTQAKLEATNVNYKEVCEFHPRGLRLLIISSCTNTTELFINRMDPEDIIEAGIIVKDFLAI